MVKGRGQEQRDMSFCVLNDREMPLLKWLEKLQVRVRVGSFLPEMGALDGNKECNQGFMTLI